MTTFKHYNKYFCGALVLVCCLFGGVGTVEALDPVDITGKCVNLPSAVHQFESITLDDICAAKGYGSCSGSTGNIITYKDKDCNSLNGGVGSAGDCSTTEIVALGDTVRSVMVTNLFCKARTWGIVPRPGNVPDDFNQSIKNTTDWILGFVGMIAVLMLIWGGINYLTSAGDEDKARTGKKTISYALIGLVVAGIAYAVVNVIITVIL